MDHREPGVKGSVQSLFGQFLLESSTSLYNGFGVSDIYIAKVVTPILISDRCCLGEFPLGERCVNLCGGGTIFVQDPKLCK